jgi:luciferase-like monooxygenase
LREEVANETRRIGEETASVLIDAQHQRDAIVRAAEEQAHRLVADATATATAITTESEVRVRELDEQRETPHQERDRLLETALAASAAIADVVHLAHRQIPPTATPEMIDVDRGCDPADGRAVAAPYSGGRSREGAGMTENDSGTAERIKAVVGSWDGVEAGPHRFGGIEFRLGRRELSHLHGDRIADLPFSRRIRDELIAAGHARPHHVLPESGWVTVSIRDHVDDVIELFRLSYERAHSAGRSPANAAARTASEV